MYGEALEPQTERYTKVQRAIVNAKSKYHSDNPNYMQEHAARVAALRKNSFYAHATRATLL